MRGKDEVKQAEAPLLRSQLQANFGIEMGLVSSLHLTVSSQKKRRIAFDEMLGRHAMGRTFYQGKISLNGPAKLEA